MFEPSTNKNNLTNLSTKNYNNRPVNVNDITVFDTTNSKLFLSRVNCKQLIINLHNKHTRNEGNICLKTFTRIVLDKMSQWSNSKNIDDYESLTPNQWEQTLNFINKQFIKEHEFLFQSVHVDINSADINVYKTVRKVGLMNNSDKKQYKDMTPDDYKTLDVWSEQTSSVQNKQYRYGNKIPMWQKSMNNRHYDRENEGFHAHNSNQASLGTHIRGFNMEHIYETINKYKPTK
jgi:hypothetical protein